MEEKGPNSMRIIIKKKPTVLLVDDETFNIMALK